MEVLTTQAQDLGDREGGGKDQIEVRPSSKASLAA